MEKPKSKTNLSVFLFINLLFISIHFAETFHGRQTDKITNNATDPCKKHFRCDDNKDKELPNCYCDRQCGLFNDCCDDFNETPLTSALVDYSNLKDSLTCRVNIMSDKLKPIRGFWMIVNCPKGYGNKTLTHMCQSTMDSSVPVTDRQGIVYGNSYCAACNGVYSYQPWTIRVLAETLSCPRNFAANILSIVNITTLTMFTSLKSRCTVAFDPPENTRPRLCLTSIQKFCDEKFINDPYRIFTDEGDIYPLNVLFSLRSPTNRIQRCDAQHEFDQNTGLCFPKNCGGGNDLPTCNTNNQILVQNYQIQVRLHLVSNSLLRVTDTQSALSAFIFCLPTEMYGIEVDYSKTETTLLLFSNHETKIHSQILSEIVLLVTEKAESVRESLKVNRHIQEMDWSYTVNRTKNPNIEIWRLFDTQYSKDSKTFDGSYTKQRIHFDHETVENIINGSLMEKSDKNKKDVPKTCNVSHTVFIDNAESAQKDLIHMDCAFREEEYEDKIRHNFTNENRTYSLLTGNGKIIDIQFVQGVLTYTSLTVSSAVLVPTLFIYRYLALSKTTPGHISENVMVVMLLFNVIFMIGIGANKNQTFCLLTSVTTHFLILSCFFWVSIFVVHTLNTLRKLRHVRKHSKRAWKQTFPNIFYVIGYVTPIVIVLPSLLVDIFKVVDVGYTGEVCFPTSFPANVVVFVSPVIISIIVNLSCLTFAAWYLFKLNMILSHQGITNSRSYVSIYIRLCFTSGLSWGLGIISEGLDNDILRFIFIVVSGSHGFIFCTCIISTKLVKDAILEKQFSRERHIAHIEMNEVCSLEQSMQAAG